MMLDCADLRWLGEQVIQVATPSGRIVAGARVDCGRIVKDRLDPLAHPTCRLRLDRPNRAQHVEHGGGVNNLHVQSGQLGIGVGR
jgi:hypothetical protein